jgi:ABC-type nickel/cobalt efflux system permease component RcnA
VVANGDLPIFVMAITIAMLIVVSLIAMTTLMIRMVMMNMKNAMEKKHCISYCVNIVYMLLSILV